MVLSRGGVSGGDVPEGLCHHKSGVSDVFAKETRTLCQYGLATVSSLDSIIGLFCRI